MKIKKIVLTLVSVFVFLIFNNININADETEEIIKVACILDNGYYIMEENGGLSGYNYDFLMLVAQYTNWKFEFVMIDEGDIAKSNQKAIELLQNGDIDLIGTIFKDEENIEYFEFPTAPAGVSRHTLVSLVSNNKINRDNYFLQEVLAIALVEGDSINEEYLQSVDVRGFENDITYVKDYDEALELLINEEVNAILKSDSSEDSWRFNYLTTIDRNPYYFVTQKGNTHLMEKLDAAIENMYIADANLSQRLFNQYFSTIYDGKITLTDEEEAALQGYDYLTVGLLKGREPYQFYNDDEEVLTGISVEILEEISKITGIEFKYKWFETREGLKEGIASKEIDIISTVPFDPAYELTSFFDVIITNPFITNATTWLHQENEVDNAIPMYYYIAENIPFYPDDELVEVFNFEDALLSLSKGGQVSIFVDPFMAQYHIQKLGLTNIDSKTVNSIDSKICFGVGKHLDISVVGLLNYALLYLDQSFVDDIVYNNVQVNDSLTIEGFIKTYSIEIFLATITFFSAIVFLLYLNSRKLKELSQRDSLTKLYNAGFFHNYAENKLKYLKQGYLILVDIDLFKQINDNYGHQQGDQVIINVANNLTSHFRKGDVVARLGGDEFIILLENAPTELELQTRCQEILDALNVKDNNIPATLSIGGYFFDKQTDYKDLYNLADSALYKVKENGRNGYLFSSKDDEE